MGIRAQKSQKRGVCDKNRQVADDVCDDLYEVEDMRAE